MRNIEKIGKIIGLLLGISYLVFFKGNEIFEWILFVCILLSIGIPHGALDHLLLNPNISNRGLINFILKYLSIISLYLLIWIFLPIAALLAFLLMSAYHFGQSHFIGNTLKNNKKIIYLLTGIFYLSIIFWGNFDQTATILMGIIDISPASEYGWPIIIASFVLGTILMIKNSSTDWHWFSLEMLFIGILLYQLPLLLGFIIYFGFWHALPSMQEEYLSLRIHLGKNQFKNFVKRMIPFTAASIGGMLTILAIFYYKSTPEDLTLLFFVLVSLISAPHIWYMNLFLETKKN
jgi:Brp/Blh family beta-carotene 15,15'-monooxygenase